MISPAQITTLYDTIKKKYPKLITNFYTSLANRLL